MNVLIYVYLFKLHAEISKTFWGNLLAYTILQVLQSIW